MTDGDPQGEADVFEHGGLFLLLFLNFELAAPHFAEFELDAGEIEFLEAVEKFRAERDGGGNGDDGDNSELASGKAACLMVPVMASRMYGASK